MYQTRSRVLYASSGKRIIRNLFVGTARVLVLPIIVAGLWWLVAAAVDSVVFPGPVEALSGLWEDLGTSGYQESITITVRLLIVSWLFSVIVGSVCGFGLGLSGFWAKTLKTPLFAIYSVPLVTLYPVFLIFFGIGEGSRVSFAVAHGIIPMTLFVMGATSQVSGDLIKLADSLVLSWKDKIWKIVIPSIIPSLVSAARIAFGLTVIGLILAGMISSSSGLGFELVNNIANVRVSRITGQILFIVVLAVVPGLILRSLELRVIRRYHSS